MKNKQYNRIQVYLDDETAEEFQQHCEEKGVKASAEVKRLILVELRGKPIDVSSSSRRGYSTDYLYKRLRKLERKVSRHHKLLAEFFDLRQEEAVNLAELFDESDPEDSQFNSTESHSKSQLAPLEENRLENLE